MTQTYVSIARTLSISTYHQRIMYLNLKQVGTNRVQIQHCAESGSFVPDMSHGRDTCIVGSGSFHCQRFVRVADLAIKLDTSNQRPQDVPPPPL
jgi:hypothetical protein